MLTIVYLKYILENRQRHNMLLHLLVRFYAGLHIKHVCKAYMNVAYSHFDAVHFCISELWRQSWVVLTTSSSYAFISSRLDYSNSLYTGISHSSLSFLQLVQNAPDRYPENKPY